VLVKKADEDGYLFGGLNVDKFGDWYKAMTKRFTMLGFGKG
jgi:hypothetical protein